MIRKIKQWWFYWNLKRKMHKMMTLNTKKQIQNTHFFEYNGNFYSMEEGSEDGG